MFSIIFKNRDRQAGVAIQLFNILLFDIRWNYWIIRLSKDSIIRVSFFKYSINRIIRVRFWSLVLIQKKLDEPLQINEDP